MNNFKILLAIVAFFFGPCLLDEKQEERTKTAYRYEMCQDARLYTLGCSGKKLGCSFYDQYNMVLPTRTVSKKEYVGYIHKNLYLNKKYGKYIKGKKDINRISDLSLNQKIYLVNMPCVRLEGLGLNCFSRFMTVRAMKVDRKLCRRDVLTPFDEKSYNNRARDFSFTLDMDRTTYNSRMPQTNTITMEHMLKDFIKSNLQNQRVNMFLELLYSIGLKAAKFTERAIMILQLPVDLNRLRIRIPLVEHVGTEPVMVNRDAPYVFMEDKLSYRPEMFNFPEEPEK